VLACEAVFGEIHCITIAFGTSLLGVGLDYVEHYYAHFVLTEAPAGYDGAASAIMKQVAPSLLAGALTTILGFIGIGASGVAGLRQMAVFSVIANRSPRWRRPYWTRPAVDAGAYTGRRARSPGQRRRAGGADPRDAAAAGAGTGARRCSRWR